MHRGPSSWSSDSEEEQRSLRCEWKSAPDQRRRHVASGDPLRGDRWAVRECERVLAVHWRARGRTRHSAESVGLITDGRFSGRDPRAHGRSTSIPGGGAWWPYRRAQGRKIPSDDPDPPRRKAPSSTSSCPRRRSLGDERLAGHPLPRYANRRVREVCRPCLLGQRWARSPVRRPTGWGALAWAGTPGWASDSRSAGSAQA